ncbi:hypothetical protein [Desulfobacula sp.]|uniref:hypothetical protein n=1 Tax=Desulfobacula sp. TaxID=2593537 RepID=UPI002616145E|nr:hypothetical protein [Desulfobacula sp.]
MILSWYKGLAEYHDMSLGNLIEGIMLHAFDGKAPFSEKNLKKIKDLKSIYELDLTWQDSHKLVES